MENCKDIGGKGGLNDGDSKSGNKDKDDDQRKKAVLFPSGWQKRQLELGFVIAKGEMFTWVEKIDQSKEVFYTRHLKFL